MLSHPLGLGFTKFPVEDRSSLMFTVAEKSFLFAKYDPEN
jgi:hypothetical protein